MTEVNSPSRSNSLRGIVVAGGEGLRLMPLTAVVSKQLLPVYDKPMIFYPLSVLMLAQIREILIVTRPEERASFERLLGDGSRYGVRFSFAVQREPRGIADALLVGEEFLADHPVALILGDNIFYGAGLRGLLDVAERRLSGAVLFGAQVQDPRAYGVAELDRDGALTRIEEKPACPCSDLAVTGLYLYGADAPRLARSLQPSVRGELEITDLNNLYLEQARAILLPLPRGMVWLDMGSHDDLLEAGQFVAALQRRQGTMIACLEEIAFRQGWLDRAALAEFGARLPKGVYADYLRGLLGEG